MKNFILSLVFLFFGIYTAKASPLKIDINGKVRNEQMEPVIGASVYLLSASTSALIKTAVTDENGNFVINDAPSGTYYVEVSAIGLAKTKSENFAISNKEVTLPVLSMPLASTAIEEVEVKGEIPLIQSTNGKLILNVENSSISAGNNALEIVKRAPGVSVDKDDNILLMGRQGVTVTIDGRQTYMTGEQLATFLKSTDGSQIKSVEVSTSRSAKDDAEGASGIINITMKKNKIEGFNGAFLASGAMGNLFRGNSSVNLNYKKNNTTLFGNYAYTNDKLKENLGITRDIRNKDELTVFDQKANMFDHARTHSYKLGIEQKTSQRNTVVAQFSGYNNVSQEEIIGVTSMGSSIQIIDSLMNSSSVAEEGFNRYSINVNNEFAIDTLGRKLTADVDYSTFRKLTNVDYEYQTLFPDLSPIYDTEYERSNPSIKIKIFATKLDYVQPIGKGNLETGLKYSTVKTDNSILFEQLVDESWQNNTQRTNNFFYTEQIAAVYGNYSRDVGKWSLTAGLRGEYTFSDGKSITQNTRVKRNYFDLFPSASVSYNAHENHVLSISYARKITRPNYRNLNPFEEYIDKRTFQRGNPYLQPEYTDGLTLNYTLYKMFNVTLGHDRTNDALVESMGQDTIAKTTWVTKENLAQTRTTYLNISAPLRVGKFWSIYNNLTGIHMFFDGPISGYYVKQGSLFFQGSSMHTFKINPAFSAEMNLNYTSPFLYNVYRLESKFNTDLGITYTMKDQRSSLKLAVTDVFRTNRNNLSTDFEEFKSTIRQYHDNQTVRLTYSYKFGNLKQSLRKKDRDSDEKNRAL